MPVKGSLGLIPFGGKTHPKWEQFPQAVVIEQIKKGIWADRKHSSFCFLITDAILSLWLLCHNGFNNGTVSQIKPFFKLFFQGILSQQPHK